MPTPQGQPITLTGDANYTANKNGLLQPFIVIGGIPAPTSTRRGGIKLIPAQTAPTDLPTALAAIIALQTALATAQS